MLNYKFFLAMSTIGIIIASLIGLFCAVVLYNEHRCNQRTKHLRAKCDEFLNKNVFYDVQGGLTGVITDENKNVISCFDDLYLCNSLDGDFPEYIPCQVIDVQSSAGIEGFYKIKPLDFHDKFEVLEVCKDEIILQSETYGQLSLCAYLENANIRQNIIDNQLKTIELYAKFVADNPRRPIISYKLTWHCATAN